MAGEDNGGAVVRLRWSWQEIAAMLTVVGVLVTTLLTVIRWQMATEARVDQLERHQAELRDIPSRMVRLETKIDLLLEERKRSDK